MASHRDILKSEGSRWCRSFSIAKAVERQDALSFKSAMIGGLSFAQATHHMQDRFRRPGLPPCQSIFTRKRIWTTLRQSLEPQPKVVKAPYI
jgi:hypothetical protein